MIQEVVVEVACLAGSSVDQCELPIRLLLNTMTDETEASACMKRDDVATVS